MTRFPSFLFHYHWPGQAHGPWTDGGGRIDAQIDGRIHFILIENQSHFSDTSVVCGSSDVLSPCLAIDYVMCRSVLFCAAKQYSRLMSFAVTPPPFFYSNELCAAHHPSGNWWLPNGLVVGARTNGRLHGNDIKQFPIPIKRIREDALSASQSVSLPPNCCVCLLLSFGGRRRKRAAQKLRGIISRETPFIAE